MPNQPEMPLLTVRAVKATPVDARSLSWPAGAARGAAAEIALAKAPGCRRICFSKVSAHRLAATPTCNFLEYVDWANVLLQEPLIVGAGHAIIARRRGNGMMWNCDAAERYRVRLSTRRQCEFPV